MSSVLCQLFPVLLALSLSCWPASAQTTVGVTADEPHANGTVAAGPAPEQATTSTGNSAASAVTEASVLNVTLNSENHSPTQGNETGRSTPGIPDVTATSQVILLQTTASSVGAVAADGRPTSGTSSLDTSPRPADIATSTVADALPAVTTKTPVVAASATPTASATTTEQTPGTGEEGSTTLRENGTAQAENGTDDHLVVLWLTFNGTCDYDASSVTGQLEGLVRAGAVGCESQVRLRMSASNVSDLDHLVGVLQLRTRGSVLTLTAVDFPDKSRGTADQDLVTRLFSGPFSSREIITYAVVGGVFGVAIILVAALLCCKCCCGDRRRKRSQDIPHLTLRLEDYSLTRIPRPNTLFGGGGAAALRNGTPPEGSRVRQSIDTSVVPIEEDFGSLRRGGLRSFSGRRLGHRDEEDANSRCSPALTGSTERLARDFGNRQHHNRGNENKNFRF